MTHERAELEVFGGKAGKYLVDIICTTYAEL